MSLRIMRNPAHDPATTSRLEYDKFAFDSESGDLAYALGINASPNALAYTPLISSMARFETGWWSLQSYAFLPSTPYVGSRRIVSSSHWGRTSMAAQGSRAITIDGDNSATAVTAPVETRYLLWQLPADSNVNPFPSGANGGARILKISTVLRVPRPGFAYDNADPNNFILHEATRPCKVIAAGRINIPAGGAQVQVILPVQPPSTVFVGGQFSLAGRPVLAPFVNEDPWTFDPPQHHVQFRIDANILTFREKHGNAVSVSYYVAAEDGSAQTSGNGPFISSGTDEFGVTYMQIRRPGAASSPSFADILVDSRWRVMPLIQQDYIQAGAFSQADGTGKQSVSVTLPALGYAPLVLVSWGTTTFGYGEGRTVYWFEGTPGASPPRRHTGMTCYTKIQDGLITFVHYFTAPRRWAPEVTNNQWSYPSVSLPMGFLGVRYYAFAIPQG